MTKVLSHKIKDAVFAVLPISILIIIINFAVDPMDTWSFISFIVGAFLLILGMGIYSLGAEVAIEPIGSNIGGYVSKTKKVWFILLVCFVIGVIVTVAEPDLGVLASQVPAINKWVLILSISLGVGVFLLAAVVRIFLKVPLYIYFIVFYAIAFVLLFFIDKNFIPLSFDSGGVTTGPITVPFIMALGVGISAVAGGSKSEENSFGLIGICSIGPIIAVIILGIFYKADSVVTEEVTQQIVSISTLIRTYAHEYTVFLKDVGIALAPIVGCFVLFQIFALKLPKKTFIRIMVGAVYTYIGLAIFLTGVNVGFMPAGTHIAESLALKSRWLIVPVGMGVGALIVLAEPAVHVLNHQVETITNGTIKRRTMLIVLSISMAMALGFSMLRVATGFNILYVLIPGYVIAIALTFFVPKTFTAIAFDSGGVASGPMTATFLLPFSIGACSALGGNIMSDAFGVVAFVAMTPLLTVQILGLTYSIKAKRIKQIEREDITAIFAQEGQIIDLLKPEVIPAEIAPKIVKRTSTRRKK